MPDVTNHKIHSALIGFGMLLAVYILCPFLVTLPSNYLEKYGLLPPMVSNLQSDCMAPLVWLCHKFPLYDEMMRKEHGFLLRIGFFPRD